MSFLESLQFPFFQNALMAGLLVGVLCSVLGVYVVLTRNVFVGVTIAQLASAGVALGLLLQIVPAYTALAFALLGVAFFAALPQRAIPVDATIGASYVFAAALGTLLVAVNPVGEARSLNVLFGNILSVHTPELVALAVLFLVVLAIHIIFYRKFLFVFFDFDTAQAMGVNARLWRLFFYLTLGITVGLSIRSMGTLVVFALLIVPAITARLLSRGMGSMFFLAALFAMLAVPAGLFAAFRFDLPTGSTVAAGTVALLAVVVGVKLMFSVASRRRLAPPLLAAFAILLIVPMRGIAQDAMPAEAWRDKIEAELQELRRENEELRQQVKATAKGVQGADGNGQAALRQGQMIDFPRLSGGLLLNPEMRVEGNFLGVKTNGVQRLPDAEGFPSDRFTIKEVEIGFRAAIDPFAQFETIISGQHLLDVDVDDGETGRELSGEVELEEAFLTFPRLPAGLQAKLGLMRSSFGEFSDGDPEELPEIDSPNIVVQMFGEEGEGWTDSGVNVNRQFGNPWNERITHMVWFGAYSGDNEVAFHGGQADRPVYFTRFESFMELGTRAGAELGISYAHGYRNAIDEATDELRPGSLRTQLANVHFEYDWQHPVLTAYRGFNFLGEVYYSKAEEDIGDRDVWGTYALGEYRFARRWAVAARLDYVDGCPFQESLCASGLFADSETALDSRREWAVSPIVSYSPSRYLTLRAQYKHTDRNYAQNSNELLVQALFIVGFERPDPF